jgi:hypothetical protein
LVSTVPGGMEGVTLGQGVNTRVGECSEGGAGGRVERGGVGGEGGHAAAHHKELGAGVVVRQQLRRGAELGAENEGDLAPGVGPEVNCAPAVAVPWSCRGAGVTGEGEGLARTGPGATCHGGAAQVEAEFGTIGPEATTG